MALQYDFLDNNFFNTYTSVETPEVKLEMPLLDDPLDISEWSSRVTSSGVPIVKPSSKMIVNNTTQMQPEEQEISSGVKGNAKQALNFFISKGLSQTQAAGVVGNLLHESGLNTGIRGDGGKAFGIAQWHPNRQAGLKALAKSKGTSITDFNTQLEYVWQELNSTEAKALKALKNTSNVEDATYAFSKLYERPGDAKMSSRIRYAKSLFKS